MATLLKIGADVTGAEKVNRLARDLREAADATDALAKSSQKGNSEFKTMSSVMAGLAREAEKLTSSISQSKNVLAGFKTSLDSIWSSGKMNSGLKEFESSIKEVGRNLAYSRQQLSDFITTSGQYSTIATANSQATHATSVALRAEEAARDGLLRTEGAYVDAKARELLLTDKAAIALTAETVAVKAQIAAYQKLNASGKMGNYEKGFDYGKQLKDIETFNEVESQLAAKEAEIAKMRAAFSKETKAALAEEVAARRAVIASVEQQFFAQQELEKQNLANRVPTITPYAQTGRERLSAGSKAGGYDYSEQMKAESKLYDPTTDKLKNQVGVLGKLGEAWDNAGKKSSVFHNLMRGASGAMGGLWLTYGQMLPMIAGFATVAATIKTVQLGAEFDDIARKISFLETSAGGAAITTEQLEKQLLTIGNSPQSLTEQAEGLLEFSRAGVSAAEALKPIQQEGGTTTTMLEQLSAMAYYSGTKLQDITAQVQKFASAYNTDVITTANVVSKIADISQASIPTMMRAFENATSQNVLFGSSIEEVAAVLGVMHDKGIDAAKAGAGLTTAMTKLVNPTKKVQEQFHQLGFTAIDTTTGKTKDLVTMFGDLQKAADKLPASMRAAFLEDSGGLRGLKAIAPGIASAEQALTNFNKTIGDYKNKVSDAGGEGGRQFTYLQRVIESLGESGKYNLDLLVASINNLFVTSYDNASSVRMMKELRDVVNSQDTKDSFTFIVDKLIWLTTAAAKTITFTIKILDSTDADTNRKLALIGGLVGARFGGMKGAALGSTVATLGGGALLDALGINDKSISKLEEAREKVKVLQQALNYQQRSVQEASNPVTKSYHNYKLDDVTKRLQAEREVVAELEKTAAAQNNIAQATGKAAGAVGKLTEAQSSAGEEALKSLDYYTRQADLVGKSEVEKVQARISETIADQKKKLDAAGMSAEEYNKVLSESEQAIKKSFGPELEAAKKKDIALTSDQILANRAATAGRRAEAEANKEAAQAMKQLMATYDLYVEKMKDTNASAREWNQNAKTLMGDIESFVKQNATVGMTKIEAETYKRNQAMIEAGKVQADYTQIVGSSYAELGRLGDEYGQSMQRLQKIRDGLSKNPLKLTQDQVDDKTKAIVNEQENLVKQYEAAAKAQQELIAKGGELKTVTTNLQSTISNTSPWDAMAKAVSEAGYTTEEMFRDVKSATDNVFKGMEDVIVEFVTTGKLSFTDLANSIISDIARIAIKQAVLTPLLASLGAGATGASGTWVNPDTGFNFGSILGSIGGLFTYHTGGVVGKDNNYYSGALPSATFTNAPRYHSGLLPDEFPAVLQKGEGVFTKSQMQALGGRGTGTKVVVNNYGTSKAFEVEQLSADEVRIIARDEAHSTVRKTAPNLIAASIADPNSRVSKSLAISTTTSRRR